MQYLKNFLSVTLILCGINNSYSQFGVQNEIVEILDKKENLETQYKSFSTQYSVCSQGSYDGCMRSHTRKIHHAVIDLAYINPYENPSPAFKITADSITRYCNEIFRTLEIAP